MQRVATSFHRDYIAALVQLSHQSTLIEVRDKNGQVVLHKQLPILAINGVLIQDQIRKERQ